MAQAKPNFKCILIGDSGVGKSCLMLRFAEGAFQEDFVSTIGVDFTNKNLELDGERVKCQLWDTAGQERFRTLTTSYYRDAQGVVIVYDISDRKSFDNVERWKADVQKHANPEVAMLIVGNKADLGEHRAVTFAEGGALAAERSAAGHEALFFETSAKEHYNVEEAFMALAHEIKRRGLLKDFGGRAAAWGPRAPEPEPEGGPGVVRPAAVQLAGGGVGGVRAEPGTDACSGCGGGGSRGGFAAAAASEPGAAGLDESREHTPDRPLSEAAAAVGLRARNLYNSFRKSGSSDPGGLQSMSMGAAPAAVSLPGIPTPLSPLFLGRFSPVLRRFSAVPLRCPASWRRDGENGRKMAENGRNLGEKRARNSGG